MTPQEISNNTKYQAALERADAKGIGIVARYTDKTGAFLGCQVQGTEGKQYHVANENNRLTCDCPAASYGNYCMHRAIVTRAEMERAAYWARYSAAIKVIESLGQPEMAYCMICGDVIANSAKVCPKCGRDVFPSKQYVDDYIDAELAEMEAEDEEEDELTELITGLEIIAEASGQQQADAAFDALNPCLPCYVCGSETGIYRDCCKKVVCAPCFHTAHKETAPQYPDYDDSNPRRDELEVTIRGYEHLLVGGIDGVVNGRDERMIEAIKKEKARIAAKEIAEPLAAQPSQVRRLYRTTTGRTQEAW